MKRLTRSTACAFLTILILLAGCSQPADHSAAISKLTIANLSQPAETVFAAGQPTQEELKQLAELGVKHIINLRPSSEQEQALDWNEAEYVESLGMQYHSIPIAGAADINIKHATQLATRLEGIGSDPVLVHCASSNRVGALIALGEGALQGKTTEQAIEEGKRWGLAGLEPVVRSQLSSR